MKALVGAFSQEKALVEAFSVIVKPMDCFTALVRNTTLLDTDWDLILAEVIRREDLQLEQLSISARLCFTKPSVNIVDIDVTIRVEVKTITTESETFHWKTTKGIQMIVA